MNTTTDTRRNLAVLAAAAITTVSLGTTAPSFASPAREPAPVTAHRSPYAISFTALNGRTLAQSLADHRAHDRRLR
jgi:hypothetical protein